MTLLAQKLNDLAAAYAEGLLHDDEYRLLRQDVFETYSANDSLPTEVPIVPEVGRVHKRVEYLPPLPPEPSPAVPAHRSKSSLVVSLIRKATGRKPPSPDVLSQGPSSPPPTFKRSFLPKVLSKKPSIDISSLRSASTRKDSLSLSSSHKASLSASGSDTFTSPPVSPTRARIASSSKLDVSSPSNDIFEDGGLATTREIRQAIIEIEIEGKKVVEAFDGLEIKALARHREHKSPRRPPLPSLPSHLTASSAHSTASSADRISTRQRSGSDVVSLRSINSTNGTSYLTPGARSPNSPKSPSPSPSSLKRKNSVSSISSQTASIRSARLRPVYHPTLSRSTGHLPLNSLLEKEDDNTELADIRRRRLEVINRYEARLEYLRARLKGAELHERLLRK